MSHTVVHITHAPGETVCGKDSGVAVFPFDSRATCVVCLDLQLPTLQDEVLRELGWVEGPRWSEFGWNGGWDRWSDGYTGSL